MPPIGGIVWELCDGTHSIENMIETITSMIAPHGALPPNLGAQVEQMIKRLQDDGFITIVTENRNEEGHTADCR